MSNIQNSQEVEGKISGEQQQQQQHEQEQEQEIETSRPVFSTNDLSELQADEDDNEDGDGDEEQEENENEEEGEEDDAEDGEEDEEEDEEDANDNNNNNDEPPLKKAKTDATIKPLPTTLPNSDLTRADKTLDEILSMLDDDEFTPIIPDAVTDYYLAKNGFSTSNIKIKRLMALATQKFINDIATDAYEYSRIRSNTAVYNSGNPQVRARALLMATVANSKGDNSLGEDGDNNDITNTVALSGQPGGGGGGGQQGQPKVCLKMEDLSSALDEYGLNVNRPQFYR